jgi:hypothetical protein
MWRRKIPNFSILSLLALSLSRAAYLPGLADRNRRAARED